MRAVGACDLDSTPAAVAAARLHDALMAALAWRLPQDAAALCQTVVCELLHAERTTRLSSSSPQRALALKLLAQPAVMHCLLADTAPADARALCYTALHTAGVDQYNARCVLTLISDRA